MVERSHPLVRALCRAACCGCVHIGLALLLILPQPAAAARLMFSAANPISENLENRPSEEWHSEQRSAAEAPRCQRCVYLPVRHSHRDMRAIAQARVATALKPRSTPFPGQRRDQLGAGVKANC